MYLNFFAEGINEGRKEGRKEGTKEGEEICGTFKV